MRRTGLAIVLVLVSLSPAWQAARAGTTQGYYLNLWRFPDPPQDPNDLPSDPATITYSSQEAFQDFLSTTPFDKTFAGNSPLASDGFTNGYSFHVVGDSDYTHLRAALRAEFTDYEAANYAPGLSIDSAGVVNHDTNLNLAQVYSTITDSALVTGVNGPVGLSLVFALKGNVRYDGDYGSYSSGFPVSGGGISLGSFAPGGPTDSYSFFDQGPVDKTITLTTSIVAGTDTRYEYGIGFAAYLPDTTLLAPGFLFNGLIDFDFASTATLSKIILNVPAGTDPANVQYRFGSGMDYDVEVRVAAAVPEPSTMVLCLTAVLLTGLIVRRGR